LTPHASCGDADNRNRTKNGSHLRKPPVNAG
jgi:hypothetical protein